MNKTASCVSANRDCRHPYIHINMSQTLYKKWEENFRNFSNIRKTYGNTNIKTLYMNNKNINTNVEKFTLMLFLIRKGFIHSTQIKLDLKIQNISLN